MLPIKNANDVDPISFEPIADIQLLWYDKRNDGIFAYDAWSWMQLICYQRDVKHPITRNKLSIEQRWKIYEACVSDKTICLQRNNAKKEDETSKQTEKLNMLKKCVSFGVTTQVKQGSGGIFQGVYFDIESPLLAHKIEAFDWCLYTFRPKKLRVTLHNNIGMIVHKVVYEINEKQSEVKVIEE